MTKRSIILAAAVIALAAAGCADCQKEGCADAPAASTQEAVLKAIATRTSVRSYTAQPIEEAKVEALLRAGMAAPTARNSQPWEFVVIRDTALINSVCQAPRDGSGIMPQLAIAVCGDMQRALPGAAQEYWVQDASAATQNILLAAHAMGLGAVWLGVYPIDERVQKVSQALQLPSSVVPMCVIQFGYPGESPAPKDKWDAKKVHYDRW